MKSGPELLRHRGFVDEALLKIDCQLSNDHIRLLLHSEIPARRTEGAIIARKLRRFELTRDLVSALENEKKLYTKIAITEALSSFGEYVVPSLIPHLGAIGNNQHYELPVKPFEKDSYPLPRDIVARTLIRIGESVVPYILDAMESMSRVQVLEAIDVLGHIAFYSSNCRSQPCLVKLYDKNRADAVVRWKLLRAFSAFNDKSVIGILRMELELQNCGQFVWEATRSLRLIMARQNKFSPDNKFF